MTKSLNPVALPRAKTIFEPSDENEGQFSSSGAVVSRSGWEPSVSDTQMSQFPACLFEANASFFATGPAALEAVDADPPPFDAVTATRIREPRSAAVTRYDGSVAAGTFVHDDPAASQRCH
jgi:hypothetical protein